MSIQLENPQTKLEKADAIANYIEQMYIAHMMHDDQKIREIHKKSQEVCFDLCQMLMDEG